MNIKNKIILALFFSFIVLKPVLGQDDSLLIPVNNIQQKPSSNFNLANIVDSFLTNESKQNESAIDDKSKIRKEFISITSKFNQGNAKVAYNEYSALIDKIDNDTSLLTLSKVLYEIGYFSLANKAIEKITYKNQFYDNILDLEKSYKPKAMLDAESEINYAKNYADIYFNNNAAEVASQLIIQKSHHAKNDFFNFTLSPLTTNHYITFYYF